MRLPGGWSWQRRSPPACRKRWWRDRAAADTPAYALAHVGPAECYYWLSNIHLPPTQAIPEGKKAAAAALKLDETLCDWDWPAAEREFRRATEFTPNSATVHLYRAFYLVTIRRFDDAVESACRARELDPGSHLVAVYGGVLLYLAHRYDDAVALMNELDPRKENDLAQAFLGLAYEQKEGGMADAINALRRTARTPANLEGKAQLAHAYAMAGRREKEPEKTKNAQTILAELQALSGKKYVSPYNIAMIHLGLGDRDQAFEWLGKAANDHSEGFSYLLVDPRLDVLHADSRFGKLKECLGQLP